VVQALALNDERNRAAIADLFQRHGIAPERLTILGHTPFDQYLAMHNKIDIALDTFPHNGHTVTCHALWMGVPTVVLAGGNFVSRMGVSIMANLGLDDLIASDPERYAATVLRLAADRQRLAALRAELRERVKTSPLCDGPGITRDIEAAYRDMWTQWCNTPRSL
jgi:protein O-GlcNAc transferase